MHRSLSHTGMNCAMLRFSHCAVPVGKAPPAGIALTGSRSPLPAAIWPSTSCTNFGAFDENASGQIEARRSRCRQLDLFQVRQRMIHGGKVLLHHRLAALAVGLLDRLLDLLDRLLARQHAADGEEAGLHDGVDARAHAGLARHLVAVDHVELDLLAQHLLLRGLRQLVPDLGRRVGRVEQEHRARHRRFKHVHLLEEAEVVAGHKAGAW